MTKSVQKALEALSGSVERLSLQVARAQKLRKDLGRRVEAIRAELKQAIQDERERRRGRS
jgi:chaperonin cofactor prefoldin